MKSFFKMFGVRQISDREVDELVDEIASDAGSEAVNDPTAIVLGGKVFTVKFPSKRAHIDVLTVLGIRARRNVRLEALRKEAANYADDLGNAKLGFPEKEIERMRMHLDYLTGLIAVDQQRELALEKLETELLVEGNQDGEGLLAVYKAVCDGDWQNITAEDCLNAPAWQLEAAVDSFFFRYHSGLEQARGQRTR